MTGRLGKRRKALLNMYRRIIRDVYKKGNLWRSPISLYFNLQGQKKSEKTLLRKLGRITMRMEKLCRCMSKIAIENAAREMCCAACPRAQAGGRARSSRGKKQKTMQDRIKEFMRKYR